jgi:hypothetical protein
VTNRVPTPNRLTTAGVDGYLHALRHTWHSEAAVGPVTVDWDELEEVEGVAGQVLAAGLLGTLDDMSLIVRLPQDARRRVSFARSGLLFALANRDSGRTTVIVEGGSPPNLAAWRRSWSPSSPSAFEYVDLDQQNLFDVAAVNESAYAPNVAGADHAAFVNPHLNDVGLGETVLRGAAHPWLRHLLGVGGRQASEEMDVFLSSVGTLVDELINNVREHAQRDVRGRPSESLVTISVGRSGGPRRLQITVMDTGPGIATTARPKVGAAASTTDEQLIRGLLLGSYEGWGRGRGVGLPKVWEVSDHFDGRIYIATGSSRVQVTGGNVRTSVSSVPLRGTVVAVSVNAP